MGHLLKSIWIISIILIAATNTTKASGPAATSQISHKTHEPTSLSSFNSLNSASTAATAGTAKTHVNLNSDSEVKIKNLLSQMSLEEKVGQMTQVTIDVVSKSSVNGSGTDEPHTLDPVKLYDAIVNHHLGSILNVPVHAFTVDHWHEVLTQIQNTAVNQTRLHIPILYGIDAIHGATYTYGATLFPQAISMAATWNPLLIKKEGEITAREVQASGIPWNFYPVMDVGRQPLWSRLWETYGEDVYLASSLGLAYLDGHKDVATCLKHFVGYSMPASGKDRTPAYITDRMLREIFLPSFAAGIRAGAQTVMINSGSIDGIPTHANHYLLTQVLRNELGFQGIAVSDWNDIIRLYTRDRVATSPEEAVQMAVMAGVDMSMVPFDFSFYDILVKLVKEQKVPMTRIDEAVTRILRVKYEIGLFNNPFPKPELKNNVGLADATRANIQAAQESITLVKNENHLLPLSRNSKILVAGPNANLLSVLNGGWTITWQGNNEDLYPKNKKTVFKAIKSKLDPHQVMLAENEEEALAKAKDADVVILCLGEKPYTETVGNIENLNLDEAQINLAHKIEATGKPVVLVMIEGRPRVIRPIADKAQAILMAFLPGMEGGLAIADILFGDVNPSGKLPITYPRAANSLIPYDHTAMEEFDGNTYNPEYPFGFGLSYTNFEYSEIQIDKSEIHSGESVKVQVRVTNTGKRAGKEVVQLYLTDVYGSLSRPVKQIKGFQKVNLQPNESRVINFEITPYDMSFINASGKRVIEPGEFKIKIENKNSGFTLHADLPMVRTE